MVIYDGFLPIVADDLSKCLHEAIIRINILQDEFSCSLYDKWQNQWGVLIGDDNLVGYFAIIPRLDGVRIQAVLSPRTDEILMFLVVFHVLDIVLGNNAACKWQDNIPKAIVLDEYLTTLPILPMLSGKERLSLRKNTLKKELYDRLESYITLVKSSENDDPPKTYDQVAFLAQDVYPNDVNEISGETIRNVYRERLTPKGFKWRRGQRTR